MRVKTIGVRSALVAAAILVAAVSGAHADNRKELRSELSTLSSQARYADALVKATALVDLTKSENNGNTQDHAEALSWAAYLHVSVGDIQGASQYFERAVDIYSKVLPADHPDLATSLNNLGYDRYRYQPQDGPYRCWKELRREHQKLDRSWKCEADCPC